MDKFIDALIDYAEHDVEFFNAMIDVKLEICRGRWFTLEAARLVVDRVSPRDLSRWLERVDDASLTRVFNLARETTLNERVVLNVANNINHC